MTDEKHNGWTNYATWRVNLEIFDGMEAEDILDLTLGAWDLRHVLQDYVENCIYESGGGNGNLAVDYALAFLKDVNWLEIAQNLIENFVQQD